MEGWNLSFHSTFWFVARIAPLSPLKGAYPLQTTPNISEFLRNSEMLSKNRGNGPGCQMQNMWLMVDYPAGLLFLLLSTQLRINENGPMLGE
jgi:hypothetical protein